MKTTNLQKQQIEALNRYAHAPHGTRLGVRALAALRRLAHLAARYGLQPIVTLQQIRAWYHREVTIARSVQVVGCTLFGIL
jgi:hypothetical protein